MDKIQLTLGWLKHWCIHLGPESLLKQPVHDLSFNCMTFSPLSFEGFFTEMRLLERTSDDSCIYMLV